ncbi:Ser/Thr protein kinase RdoA involved in Cpx stress response, MazF antagonist [Nannocystis exedens]|uniref:Ser/Thr protein kinase RdoA involved in Cpx stress response, MazF antagonist n=1 Tax=Nannocystis exedens TaxID=54 RepID=A0A1I1U3T0_9BACT|nr:aminoglycoside phosphotransferase family protein [Nannocystis exedens]PCC71410.1 Phosphotransferase enzyme family protein [Nannocystis exedens]SFD65472.1 Ser/Thr protein kinase RdoA involved in Cpx stress response, MazF antagonist [Nannocystis exedens]
MTRVTPELRALASRVLEDVPESMLFWTCLQSHPQGAAIWRVTAPAGALVLKQHRHPRPFSQELRAYREWLPALARAPLEVGPLRLDVPALLACDPPTRTLALTAAPGERLSLGTHDPALVPAAHAAAGRFLRALHELPVADDDPLPLVDAVAARQDEWHARARDLLTPAERDALQRLAARRDAFAGARRVPCHRDFTPDNWLLAADGLHVLDFEHARLDAPEADLVKLHADVWPDRPDLAEAFLAGYGPLTPDATARLDVLLALHAVATLAWAERHADPAFEALGRRALAVALARS